MDHRKARKIDIHVHWGGGARAKAKEDLAEQMRLHREEYGIEKMVVFASSAELDQILDKHPDIIPFLHIDMDEESPGRIAEARRQGCYGVKFILPMRRYDDDGYLPLYEECAKQNMIALFHTGVVAGAGGEKQRHKRTSSDFMRPSTLDRVGRVFPELTIIGAHIGYPWYNEAAALQRWHKNIYFDGSTAQFHYVNDKNRVPGETRQFPAALFLKMLYQTGDLHLRKTLFGSDTALCVGRGTGCMDWCLPRTQQPIEDMGWTQAEVEDFYWNTSKTLLEKAGCTIE